MADKDIAPELLERIRADFRALLGDAKPAADTYAAAADYAELVGSALAEAFRRNLTADALPDGRLYWNIADRVVRPLLEEEHLLVADASAAVQQALNQQANLGIAPQPAEQGVHGGAVFGCGVGTGRAGAYLLPHGGGRHPETQRGFSGQGRAAAPCHPHRREPLLQMVQCAGRHLRLPPCAQRRLPPPRALPLPGGI